MDEPEAAAAAASSPPCPDLFTPLAIGQDLAPLPEYKAAATTTLDFGGLLAAAPLLLHEDLTSGCGGQLWPAGMVLGRHMLRYHLRRLERGGARILELGAGGGLVSLALAQGLSISEHRPDEAGRDGCTTRKEKPRLLITDQQAMMPLMEHNIRLNGVENVAKATILNWGEALPKEVVEFRPDVILAADCVYFEPAFPLLLATLSDLLRLCPSATIFFCFKKRRRADMQFLKKAGKAFCVVEVPDEDRPFFSREGLFLYAITAAATSNKTQQSSRSSMETHTKTLADTK